MKTQDFMDALGSINEKYLKDMLEEPLQSVPAAKPLAVSKSSGQKAVSVPADEPHAPKLASGIFRYLVLCASAAACIGGIALLVTLGNRKPVPVQDSVQTNVTEITTGMTTALPVTETTVSSSDSVSVTETAVYSASETTAESTVQTAAETASQTEQTTTDSAAEETVTEPTETAAPETVQTTESSVQTSQTSQTAPAPTTAETTVTTTTLTEPEYPHIETPPTGPPNSITVHCIDLQTGKPLPGVEIAVIELPKSDAALFASGVSDESGERTFGNLTEVMYQDGTVWKPPYAVRVEKTPAGYLGGYDFELGFGYQNGYHQDIYYYFVPDSLPKTMSLEIRDYDDGSVINVPVSIEIWYLDTDDSQYAKSAQIYDLMPGEQFGLPDGNYFASVNTLDAEKYGYRQVYGNDPQYASQFDFTVKDGKPDRELYFTLEKDSFRDLKYPDHE